MKGLIIVNDKNELSYEQRRIADECLIRKVDLEIVNYSDLGCRTTGKRLEIINRSEKLDPSKFKWCIPYSSSNLHVAYTELKTIVIRNLMAAGVHVVNGTSLIEYPYFSKATQMELFVHYGFNTPKTGFYADKSLILEKYPVVIKKILSGKGRGVVFVKDNKNLDIVLAEISIRKAIVQDFIPDAIDVRVMVNTGKVVASVVRKQRLTAKNNLKVLVSGAYENDVVDLLAIQIAKKLNLEFCGIDFLVSGNTTFLIEVNRQPHFKGVERTTGLNIAESLVYNLVK